MASALTDKMELDALAEKVITVAISAEKVMVSGATVTTPDIAASNGVIHVIDAVMTVTKKKSRISLGWSHAGRRRESAQGLRALKPPLAGRSSNNKKPETLISPRTLPLKSSSSR